MTEHERIRAHVQERLGRDEPPPQGRAERAAVIIFSLSALLGFVPGLIGLFLAIALILYLVGIPLLAFALLGHYLAFRYWRALWSGKRTSMQLWVTTALYNLALGVGTVCTLNDATLRHYTDGLGVLGPAVLDWQGLPAAGGAMWFVGLVGLACCAAREVWRRG